MENTLQVEITEESFKAMAETCSNFINAKDYEGFKQFLEFNLKVTQEQMETIARRQLEPGSKGDLSMLGLQVAYLSGQIYILRAILAAPGMFIQKYNDMKEHKQKEGEKHYG